MPSAYEAFVREVTQSTGATGNIVLTGPPRPKYRTFASVYGSVPAQSFWFTREGRAVGVNEDEVEVSVGKLNGSGEIVYDLDQSSQPIISYSTNGGARVNWTAASEVYVVHDPRMWDLYSSAEWYGNASPVLNNPVAPEPIPMQFRPLLTGQTPQLFSIGGPSGSILTAQFWTVCELIEAVDYSFDMQSNNSWISVTLQVLTSIQAGEVGLMRDSKSSSRTVVLQQTNSDFGLLLLAPGDTLEFSLLTDDDQAANATIDDYSVLFSRAQLFDGNPVFRQ